MLREQVIGNREQVRIIGAGLAGCEAAYRLSKRGIKVILYDIKPEKRTPAHHSDKFAELVCSNSLKSEDILTASGLLKAELRLLDSLILKAADQCRVAAGTALAVDRDLFSEIITGYIKNDPNIEIRCGEVTELSTRNSGRAACHGDTVPDPACRETCPHDPAAVRPFSSQLYIVASGPLTSPALLSEISRICGRENLAFFDAAAPVVTEESIDMSCAFRGARYGKGGDDYINCPLTKEEYERFYNALITAGVVTLKGFESQSVFEGCMPIEVLAKRAPDAIRFGPLRPIGFQSFVMGTGAATPSLPPYAVVQLRREKAAGVIYNIVGFQTNLTFRAQKEVFSLIPALKNAEFARYGVMHKNAFVNAPAVLDRFSRLKAMPNVFIAGQLSGVEGYMESAASGLYCALNAAALVRGTAGSDTLLDGQAALCQYHRPPDKGTLSADTMIGALINYITTASEKNFQPMNANFGILNPLDVKNKQKRYQAFYQRSVTEITSLLALQNE